MMLKGQALFALLSADPATIGKQIDKYKLAMLKLKFKAIKCTMIDKASTMSAALLTTVDKQLR